MKKDNRVGEIRMQNCGMEAAIIEYSNCMDVTVKFIDGAVVKHKPYNAFLLGKIGNPNLKMRNVCLGETRMQNCGMEATIIDYPDYGDITVKFTDGTVVEHKSYGSFKKGEITNPNINGRNARLNETRMMNCGMEATIIEYLNAKDIIVKFTDGAVVEHKTYNSFKLGAITHPKLNIQQKCIFYGFKVLYAWSEEDGRVFYKCQCLNCMTEEQIMTPQQMMAHKCHKE